MIEHNVEIVTRHVTSFAGLIIVPFLALLGTCEGCEGLQVSQFKHLLPINFNNVNQP